MSVATSNMTPIQSTISMSLLLQCCDMASLVRSVVVFCVLFAAAVCDVSAAISPGGKLLARSEFHWDNDGWKGYSKRRVVRVDVDMGQVLVPFYF
jgi:hypothetical protein